MEEDLDRQEAPALEDVSHLPLYRAECFSDAPELIQWIRKREPFVLSLEGAPVEAARRIVDFLCGAVFLAGGSIRRLTADHFLITPPEERSGP